MKYVIPINLEKICLYKVFEIMLENFNSQKVLYFMYTSQTAHFRYLYSNLYIIYNYITWILCTVKFTQGKF